MSASFASTAGRWNPTTGTGDISPLADPASYADHHGVRMVNAIQNGSNVFVEFENYDRTRAVVTGVLTATRDDSDGIVFDDLVWHPAASEEYQLELACASEWLMEETLAAL